MAAADAGKAQAARWDPPGQAGLSAVVGNSQALAAVARKAGDAQQLTSKVAMRASRTFQRIRLRHRSNGLTRTGRGVD